MICLSRYLLFPKTSKNALFRECNIKIVFLKKNDHRVSLIDFKPLKLTRYRLDFWCPTVTTHVHLRLYSMKPHYIFHYN